MAQRPSPVPRSRSGARLVAREAARAQLPSPLPYPPDLPITARRGEILAALASSQVLVVAGETGSGKSTQLPKLCLEAGRGSTGMIGHTQPRRIAARSVGERVAEELAVAFGGPVGYKVRFTDRVSDMTLIKLMTDGVLLAELHGDPMLTAYDTLIIDEAHERSLNIDFILGYLRQLLGSRPDLKVVITSATIDTERFSRHFADAPVIEVSGRAYPVEIRYRPMGTYDPAGDEADLAVEGPPTSGQETSGPAAGPGAGEDDVDEIQAVCDAVAEMAAAGPGDILVFLAGEREIRDTAEALAKMDLPALEILPLYGRLSSAEQHRIFEAHAGRRAILATNVAETSLTVPGIRYVVDPGTARISRYSRRTKVQRLPTEPISQASANQRAGRCGRLGPGICTRLYSEEDFAARRPFTEPEILRTNLASVILQMAAIGLGEVEEFPFVDPPDRRNVKDGITLLEELGALVPAPSLPTTAPPPGGRLRLSPVGRQLAKLPLDPRLGRMVLEAGRTGCLQDVVIIAAALSVQDPRERPADKRDAAAALHKRFDDDSSDFLSYLALWDYLDDRQNELSSSQFRRLCRRELISYQRAREWQDVHGQLVEICRQIGLEAGTREPGPLSKAGRALVHRALLAGLATQVGARPGDRGDFAGTRGARFAIWPGSVLANKPPRWVMAAELVETGRLWARVTAPVDPHWLERAAAHLLKWSYSEAAWDPERAEGAIVARANLYGLPVVVGRRLELARTDTEAAREMFIRRALVEGDWDSAPALVGRNIEQLRAVRALAQRARRHDLAVGDEALFEFYDARLGPEVTSGRSFLGWWSRQARSGPGLLEAHREDLSSPAGAGIDAAEFPDAWPAGDVTVLPLHYDWEPGSEDDGVTVEVPLSELDRLVQEGLEWQVPGLREELVTALLRSLPKDVRRHLVPVAGVARGFVAKAGPSEGPLSAVLARAMTEVSGTRVQAGDFDWSKVPGYLRPTYRVVGARGQLLAKGKDISALVARLRPQLERALQEAAATEAPAWGGPGRRSASWDFGDLPDVFEAEWHGYPLRGYPALVDEGDAVSVRVLPDQASQRLAMAAATRRLVLLNLPSRHRLVSALERVLDNRANLALGALRGLSYRSARDVVDDVLAAAIDRAVAANGGPPRDAGSFAALLAAVRRDVGARAQEGVAAVARMLPRLAELRRQAEQLWARAAEGPPASPLGPVLEDVASQLTAMAAPGLVSRAGLSRLADVERYLGALERRLAKLPAEAARDLVLARRAQALQRRLDSALEEARRRGVSAGARKELEDVRWMVEELRVSFFGQSLGTRGTVSEARIGRTIDRLLDETDSRSGA